MGIKAVSVSDFTGEDIPDDRVAVLAVSDHPVLDGRTVLLDIEEEWVDKLIAVQLELVTIDVMQDGETQRLFLDMDAFTEFFPDGTMEDRLMEARPLGDEQPTRQRPVRKKTPKAAQKVNYTDPEYCGLIHKGRVTEAEATWVRENLDAANANRANASQVAIDPSDPKEKARYGF